MKKPDEQKMKVLLVLSILVPVSFLATFRLTGVLKQPAEVEKITVEPVTLTLTRPTETIDSINKTVQNLWTQEGTFVTASISIYSYYESAAGPPFSGNDGLVFKTYVNASFSKRHITTVKISFLPLDNNAILLVSEERWALHLDNATLTALHYWGADETDAIIKANVLNSPCNISDQIFWIFLDENESHELQINVEITFFSETSGKIIIIPMKLEMTPLEGK